MNSGEMQLTLTGVSAAAITAYKFAKLTTPETDVTKKGIEAAADSTVPVLGITQTDANAAGQAVRVGISGVSKLTVDGTTPIAVGDRLVPTTGGVGINASAASNTEQNVGAEALEASSASGDVILVKIVNYPLVKGAA